MKNWLYALLLTLPLGASANERIVSIGGDVTEIIYALGAEQQLIARDSTSLHPAATQALPDVGYMRQLNVEGILSLKPSLVIASELSHPSLVLKQVADSGVKVVMVPAQPTLESIPQKINTIAQALHKESEGNVLTDRYQHGALNFPFSVRDVVAMGRTPYRHDRASVVDHVMALTECTALAHQDYRHLSGGEQQRVQLARVLAQLWHPTPMPCWLFLDEPTSALDLYHQ